MSARLDGEAEPPGADAHLAECAPCRTWADDAATLTRSLRVREAVETPDLVDVVLRSVCPPAEAGSRQSGGSHPAWTERAGRRRFALGIVAIAQLTIGMGQFFGVAPDPHTGHVDPATTAHLLNESTAWTMALGVGLAWAALRPAVITGVLITVAGYLAVLTPFAVADLISGTATVSRVATHAILLLAVGLLIAIGRDPNRAHREPILGVATTATTGRGDPGPISPAHLRPVSRKSAA